MILTDTVGFIQNLPHDLVAAFRATLEEVNEADLVLHVVDASSEMRDEQMQVVDSILEELGAADKPQLILFNKKDACTPEQLEMLPSGTGYLKISAFAEGDLLAVREAVQTRLTGDTLTFRVPAGRGDILSQLHRVGEVIGQDADNDDMIYTVQVHKPDYEKYGYIVESYKEQVRPSDQ